jgi:hypothetical protein
VVLTLINQQAGTLANFVPGVLHVYCMCTACVLQAIDPDNTDGYQAKLGNGFNTTKADTLNFLTFLSTEAKAQGLGIGLKNTLELISGNTALWDFAVNEQCYDYTECNFYIPFQQGACRPCVTCQVAPAPKKLRHGTRCVAG